MDSSPEYALIALKPDAKKRGLEDEIYGEIEKAGLNIITKKSTELDREDVANLYSHVGDKDDVYRAVHGIHRYLEGEEVEIAVVSGKNASETLEDIIGAEPYPEECNPETIRGATQDPESPFHSDSELYKVNHEDRDWHIGIRNLVHFTDDQEEFAEQIDYLLRRRPR